MITPSGATNAVVSFDGTTGQVDTVSPFVIVRGATAKPSKENGQLVYRARFISVYNAEGRNIAPSGASELDFDGVSGRLVAHR